MKPNFKINWKTLLGAVLIVALAYLILSGRIPLGGDGRETTGPSDISVVITSRSAEGTGVTTQLTTAAATEKPSETAKPATTEKQTETESKAYEAYRFRNKSLLNSHYEKHGIEMGFKSAQEYEKAASDVINNPAALYKTEKEDGDHVYYIVATNEFVVLSRDGYIRTYFKPAQGKKYFDRQ